MNSKAMLMDLEACLNAKPCYKIDTVQLAFDLCQELTQTACSKKIRMFEYEKMASCVASVNDMYLAFRKLAQKKYCDRPDLVGDSVLRDDLLLSALPKGYELVCEETRLQKEAKMRGRVYQPSRRSVEIMSEFITDVLMGRYVIKPHSDMIAQERIGA